MFEGIMVAGVFALLCGLVLHWFNNRRKMAMSKGRPPPRFQNSEGTTTRSFSFSASWEPVDGKPTAVVDWGDSSRVEVLPNGDILVRKGSLAIQVCNLTPEQLALLGATLFVRSKLLEEEGE